MITQLLIADSDAAIIKRCGRYFGKRGYQVELATNGLECLAALKRVPRHVLVLEWQLLWGGGDGVLAYLREGCFLWPETVIVTSGEPARVGRRTLEAPVKAVLRRPFSVVELFHAVHRAQFGDTYLALRYREQAREVAALEQQRHRRGEFELGRAASVRGGGVNRFI